MDFFTPIVTINETPPEASPSKSPKIKKIKIKIDGSEEGNISAEIIKPKRGRPKKVVSEDDTKEEKPKIKRQRDDDSDDPTWRTGPAKKKKKTKKHKTGRKSSEPKKKSPEKEKPVEVKTEPPDVSEHSGVVVIKKEIKEEPLDGELTVPGLPFSEDELKAMLPSEDTRTFKCPLCSKEKQDKTERTPKELKEHYKLDHPGKRLRQSRFSLEIHPCDICGKEFKTNTAVKEHTETHSNYFYCEVCNLSHKKILDHIIHLRVHSDAGIFQCLMCDLNTPDINQITDHVNNHEDLLKYWCNTCKKGFQILPWFQEHDNYHTGLKPFDCEFCGKCFLYSRFLHAHKINMHKEDMNCPSLHECVICKKQYQHKNSLKLHMNSHTGNFSICDICGKMLSSKEKLKFHIRTHTGYKPYSCTYCEKSFTKKPILVEHVRIHTGERPYVCDYCTKAFSQRSSLVIHIRGHTGERPYVCQFCTKGFVAKAMLNIHLKSCKGIIITAANMSLQTLQNLLANVKSEEEEIIIYIDEEVDLSDLKLEFNDGQSAHNKNILIENSSNVIQEPSASTSDDNVDNDKLLLEIKEPKRLIKEVCKTLNAEDELIKLKSMENSLCAICGKFVRSRGIARHMSLHSNPNSILNTTTEEEPNEQNVSHYCPKCRQTFKSTTEYAIHCFRHTETYPCPLCDFASKSKNSIVGHIKRHEGKYTHFCGVCGKGFIGKALLMSHEEIHLDIKRYCCEFCDKKFSVRRYLDIHRQLNHKKELYGVDELYQCNICNRNFTFEKSMMRHRRVIHQIGEDRTVECPICHKIIANNYNLKLHMRIHTGEKYYCCDVCGKAFSAYKYWKKHKMTHERQGKSAKKEEEKEDAIDVTS